MSNPFLLEAFRTLSYRIRVTVNADGTWSYEEEGTLQIPGHAEPFPHIDRNTLTRVGPPVPNPLAQAAGASRCRCRCRCPPASPTRVSASAASETPSDRYRFCSLPHFGHTVAYFPPLHLSHARQDSQWSWPLSISRYFPPGRKRTVMMTAATTPKMIQ